MNITWREGVTTLAATGAILVERAYFHGWDWPLVSSTRWVIAGLALLIALQYIFSYVMEKTQNQGWSYTANVLVVIAAVLTGFGLAFPASDYTVLLMLTAVTFWVADILSHLPKRSISPQVHA